MRHSLSLRSLTALLIGLGCLPALAQSSLEGRVIVRWKADAPTVKAKALRERAAAHEVADLMQRRADALGQRSALTLRSGRALDAHTQVVFGSGLDSATLAKRLALDPQVAFVAVDRIRRHSLVPNDPLYASGGNGNGQWYLKPPSAAVPSSINAEGAWNRTTGAPTVAVAVLDTGVRLDHPDLAGNLLPGYDMIGAGGGGATRLAVANDGDLHDADPSDPGDWISQEDINSGSLGPSCTSADIGDSSWHGTKVAGLVAAVGNNGVGVAGVAYTSKIVPVRVLGKCGGYDSDILAGIKWAVGVAVPGISAVNATPVKVINMSLGSTGACTGGTGQLYRDAIAEANSRGAAVVVAAGNSAGEPVDSPANCNGAIAVTGLRHAGSKVGFSSMGPEVTVAAPGGNCVNLSGPCLYPMLSTDNAGARGPGLNTYTHTAPAVGTSFATPLVAGAAALAFSANPNLTPAQLRTALQQSARPFPTSGSDAVPPPSQCPAPRTGVEVLECYCTTTTCGAGMMDVAALIEVVAPTPAPPPPPPPAPEPSSGGGGGAFNPLWVLALGWVAALLRRR